MTALYELDFPTNPLCWACSFPITDGVATPSGDVSVNSPHTFHQHCLTQYLSDPILRAEGCPFCLMDRISHVNGVPINSWTELSEQDNEKRIRTLEIAAWLGHLKTVLRLSCVTPQSTISEDDQRFIIFAALQNQKLDLIKELLPYVENKITFLDHAIHDAFSFGIACEYFVELRNNIHPPEYG